MSNPKLKIGLGRMIAKVESLPVDTKFIMVNFCQCVIGKVLYNGTYWGGDQQRVLKNRFDISRKQDSCLFADQKSANYSDEQWAVIRLFTDNIGDTLLRDEWLEIAKEQYNSMT